MTARNATNEEVSSWNELVLKNADGGNVFSSYEYSQIKKLTEYKPRYIIANDTAITVLDKKAFPFGSFWYLPKGPGVTTSDELFNILAAIRPLAKKAGAFMIRIEPELQISSVVMDNNNSVVNPSTNGAVVEALRKAAPIIPNPSTITIDISGSLDEVLTNLPQKGRHAIRRAERDGVTVRRVSVSDDNAAKMYALLSETAEGQFGIRSYNYYKTYWSTFADAGLGQLFFAYYQGEVVAGAYAMVFGKKSTYKDGASVRLRSAYGASHLLQWNVINWAKSKGSEIHDLCGSPPSNQIDNSEHPHYGIGRFKLSFSKNVVDFIGCYDLVISKSRHTIWTRIGERVHRHFYYKRTKDYYY